MNPNVYIVAGPNGAGKTTFARKFLPNYADCKNFINADLIAAGLSPLAPDIAAVRAGRLMLEEIERFANRKIDFGFETTLSGRTYLRLIKDGKRVLHGGHNVPEADVRRRFGRSIRNLLLCYRPLTDSWFVFDNSGRPSLAAFEKHREIRIINTEAYDRPMALYGGNT